MGADALIGVYDGTYNTAVGYKAMYNGDSTNLDNNIANINEMSDEQIMKAIGQDDGSSKGVNIPRLGINRSPEDDEGNQLLFLFRIYGTENEI